MHEEAILDMQLAGFGLFSKLMNYEGFSLRPEIIPAERPTSKKRAATQPRQIRFELINLQ